MEQRTATGTCSSARLRTIQTLIVDDNPLFLERTLRWLSREPSIHVIGQAMSGEAAVTQVRVLLPDLVIMDVAMEGLNGIQAAKRIKEQPNPPAIILMSVHDLEAMRKFWIRQVDAVVAKDYFSSDLPRVLKRIFPWYVSGGPSTATSRH